MKKRNIVLGVASLALCFSCLFSPKDVEAAQPKYVIKFATVAPEGSAWMKQMEALDREIRSKSKGQLGFRIYAGGVAGDELDVLKKIHIGQIQCAAFSGKVLARSCPWSGSWTFHFCSGTMKRWIWFVENCGRFSRKNLEKKGLNFWAGQRLGM